MTREEAHCILECMEIDLTWALSGTKEPMLDVLRQRLAAINVAQAALRPVSREMVEKAFPGCKHCTKQKVPFCYDGASDSVYILTGNGLAAIESDSWGFLVSYCPRCGRPLTDEAVQMVIERMKNNGLL